ncbi:hypothetical protein [Oryzomonas rubra]|uniref:Uncharacterized protein n=1 Tax=Oryzomonas rubra TaxID=2509454 RepID=A0A5A9X6J4_9BACT|nr:hypothetical protein [Oryzomonas rubra]KAA0888707.1 hypothetical protein ET418_15110 [Oryzomonas rubra]
MIYYITNFKFNSFIGILLFWVPLAFCAVGYTIRTAKDYMEDKTDRAKAESEGTSYSPTVTVGTLIGRGIVSVVPIANIWAALFDVAPELFSKTFLVIGKLFNIPLVPKRKKQA